ncbi:MAG: DNA primase [Bacteroidia bacterium]|nr:MAG: DNA primase [Bacteroidia bacterium]
MIDRSTVDRIISSVRIEDVVGEYVRLDKRGANLQGLCPFHNEKTPSFNVSPSRGIFKCFGCGKGGNVVTFLMEKESISFLEAIRILAKRANIELDEKPETPEERERRGERESLMAVLDWATAYFHNQLTNSEEGVRIGLAYLQERGLTRETIDRFGLGYSPESAAAMTSAGQQAGYKLDYLVKSGLTTARDGRTWDRFRGRVIFPIYSVSGRTIGFGGRALRTGERIAKYLNSPESEVYHKSDTLYGLAQSKSAIAREDECILVEGYLDVLSLYQLGVQNVVASSGTSLTQEQVRLLSRFSKNVTILYDGDGAGIKAAERGADILLSQGLFVRIALLPDGQDPDDFARTHTLEQVREFIAQERTDFIRFKTNRLLQESESDPAQRAQLTQDLLRSIALVDDQILRAVYVQETARVMGLDEGTLTDQLSRLRLSRSINPRPQAPRASTPASEPTQPGAAAGGQPAGASLRSQNALFANELDLIRLLLLYGKRTIHVEQATDEPSTQGMSVAQYIIESLEADDITLRDEDLATILSEYREHIAEIDDGVAYFSMHERPRIVELVVDLSVPKYKLSKRWEQGPDDEATAMHTLRVNLEHSMLSYKARLLEQLTREAMEGLDSLEGEALEARLREIQELNAIRNEFAREIQRIIP